MNIEKASEELGLTTQEYIGLLEMFADVGMSDFQKIQTAMVDGDIEFASRTAHSLKGSAGSLGLTDIYELACDTERLLRCGRYDEAMDVIRRLEQKMNEFTVPV